MSSIYRQETISKRTGKKMVRYRAFDRDLSGRQVAKTFSTKRDAEEWLRRRTAGKVTGTLGDHQAGSQRFEDLWAEVHREVDYAPATRRLHDVVWRQVSDLARRPIRDISVSEVSRVLGRIAAPGMREKARVVLSAMFSHAVREGRLTTNPAHRTSRPSTRASRVGRNGDAAEVRRLTMGELSRLVEATPARYRAMVRLMAHEGLRPGEAYALKVSKIDFEEGTIRIDTAASGMTKTGEARTIPLFPVVAEVLREHIERYSDPGDPAAYLFTTEAGRPVGNSFIVLFKRAALKAGVNHGLRVNDLRHTAAAFAIAQGANVYDVAKLLGHAKASITLDVYGFLWSDSLEGLSRRLDPAIREQFG
jgi:integrase